MLRERDSGHGSSLVDGGMGLDSVGIAYVYQSPLSSVLFLGFMEGR